MKDAVQIELDAFALYKAFMRGHPRRQLCRWRDGERFPVTDDLGDPIFETSDQAARRRWYRLSERIRGQFFEEATKC